MKGSFQLMKVLLQQIIINLKKLSMFQKIFLIVVRQLYIDQISKVKQIDLVIEYQFKYQVDLELEITNNKIKN